MPTTPRYDKQRPKVTPPHVGLRDLRTVSGMTLDQVCAEVTKILGLPETKAFTRGALSAIENGHRGASAPVLRALAVAYGLEEGALRTDFIPRDRELDVAS